MESKTNIKSKNHIHSILLGLFFLFAFPSFLFDATTIFGYILPILFVIFGLDLLVLGFGYRRIVVLYPDYLLIRDWYRTHKVSYTTINQLDIQKIQSRFPSRKLVIVTNDKTYLQSDYYGKSLEEIQQMIQDRVKITLQDPSVEIV